MTTVALVSPKGGVGGTLVAVNVAVDLAARCACSLVDLHLRGGDADLHLDLEPERDWTDLLPVAGELTDRHLELALTMHSSGLALLAAPKRWRTGLDIEPTGELLAGLSRHFDWLIIDAPTGFDRLSLEALRLADMALIVTTADPPALRSAAQLRAALPFPLPDHLGLVINQMSRTHPADPGDLAESLNARLLAVLPTDPQHVGYQVNFGQPAVLSRGSRLGREIKALVRRLESWQPNSAADGSDRHLLEPEPERLR